MIEKSIEELKTKEVFEKVEEINNEVEALNEEKQEIEKGLISQEFPIIFDEQKYFNTLEELIK